MLKLKNSINKIQCNNCGNWDGNCIFCDLQSWDSNRS